MFTNEPRRTYASDLTDEQWALMSPMIPAARHGKQGGRPREVAMREVVNTILYLNRSGCQWDMLPHDLLPKSTVYGYFAQCGGMTEHGGGWLPLCDRRCAGLRGEKRRPVQDVSTVNRLKPRRWAAKIVDTTAAGKSKAESVICWSIRWGC